MDMIRAAAAHRRRVAVVTSDRSYTYGDILVASNAYMKAIASELQSTTRPRAASPQAQATDALAPPLHPVAHGGHRVALLAPPGPELVAAMFAIWRASCVAVPLALSHPRPELAYALSGKAGDGRGLFWLFGCLVFFGFLWFFLFPLFRISPAFTWKRPRCSAALQVEFESKF
jgi:acyl-CoA synthetase (AMP-forming)/AMP-acid ligase II